MEAIFKSPSIPIQMNTWFLFCLERRNPYQYQGGRWWFSLVWILHLLLRFNAGSTGLGDYRRAGSFLTWASLRYSVPSWPYLKTKKLLYMELEVLAHQITPAILYALSFDRRIKIIRMQNNWILLHLSLDCYHKNTMKKECYRLFTSFITLTILAYWIKRQ